MKLSTLAKNGARDGSAHLPPWPLEVQEGSVAGTTFVGLITTGSYNLTLTGVPLLQASTNNLPSRLLLYVLQVAMSEDSHYLNQPVLCWQFRLV